jgi:hypothetical protein
LLASFVEYLDQSWPGVVTDGTLLETIKAIGLEAGMFRVLGQSMTRLEQGWQAYLAQRYGHS